jgi:spermidine synthase
MDAKEAINKLVLEDKKYDLILIDVYWNNWNIPESFKEKSTYENIKKILELNGTLSINYADYRWINIWKYNKIHFFLKELFGENYIHILSEKETKWNVSWIYNLDKKYNSIDVNLKYLEKVKKAEILYDSNMIKNIIIEN